MRRDRVDIWTDILQAVRTADRKVVPSRIQRGVNLPHDRFWRYVEEMTQRGLLEEEPLRTTDEGERFLDDTLHWREMMRRGPVG